MQCMVYSTDLPRIINSGDRLTMCLAFQICGVFLIFFKRLCFSPIHSSWVKPHVSASENDTCSGVSDCYCCLVITPCQEGLIVAGSAA